MDYVVNIQIIVIIGINSFFKEFLLVKRAGKGDEFKETFLVMGAVELFLVFEEVSHVKRRHYISLE